MLRLIVIVAAVLLGAWVLENAEVMHKAIQKQEKQETRIHLQGVEVNSFEKDGLLETRVVGDDAWLDKKLSDLEIRPAKLEIFEAGVRDSVVTAKIGRKRTVEGVERFEFEGNVVGRGAEGRQLYGEVVHYHLKTRNFLSPQPATLIATDTRISGDSMQGDLDTKQATVKGDVKLTSIERPLKGPVRTLKVTGDEADADFQAKHHRVRGNVHAVQENLDLRCKILDFFEEQQSLIAVGSVRAKDGELTITGEQLEYRLDTRRALGRGAPRVVQKRPTGEIQELTAREILASSQGKWMRGKGSVRVVTRVPEKGKLVTDATITAEEVEAFYESGRATFKGDVEIDSRGSNAEGDNAVYYRESRRVYVNGDAVAWEKNAAGEVVRRVQGEHILHYLDTGKSVVLGGVSGYLQEGQ